MSVVLSEKYFIKLFVFFFVFSQKIVRVFSNMNFDEIDKNRSGGSAYLLHTNKLFICPKIFVSFFEGYDVPLQS